MRIAINRHNKVFLLFIGLLLGLGLVKISYAGYQFDKVRLVLSPSQPIDTIRFSNPAGSSQAVYLQITTVKWTQNDGKDIFEPTKDLIVAPPIMNIQPGMSQITRVGWRTPKPITQELAYRMIVQDLTPYQKLDNAIRFRLQANMPVFIKPSNPVLRAQWRVKRLDDKLQVTNINTGNIHIQVTAMTITNANNEVVATLDGGYYVLPNQSITKNLTIRKPPGVTVTINANTDNGKLESNVAVS